MDQEEWRIVPDTEGLLEVSNLGNVRSKQYSIVDKRGVTQTFKPIDKKLTLGNNGYYHFRFRGKLYLLHRCIALCFVDGYSQDRNIVNHLDGNKLNNSPDNLEWTTYAGNSRHAVDSGLIKYDWEMRRGEETSLSKLTNDDVLEIKKCLMNGESCTDISKRYSVSTTVISNIKRKSSWDHVNVEGFDDKVSVQKRVKLTEEETKYILDNFTPNCRVNGVRALSRKFNVDRCVIWRITGGVNVRP